MKKLEELIKKLEKYVKNKDELNAWKNLWDVLDEKTKKEIIKSMEEELDKFEKFYK